MAMCYIQVYYDWLEAMEALSDEERGRLLVTALRYARGEVLPELTGGERYLWPMVRAQIDRDRAAYEHKTQARRANGAKGGRPRNLNDQKEPGETGDNQPVSQETKKRQEEEKEEEKEEERIPPSTPRRGEARERAGVLDDRFAAFWSAYPRKVGKAAARKAWARIRPTAELHARMLEAVEAQRHSAQWTRDGGQYIPHPATWLIQGRWDDVVSTYAAGAPADARGPKQVIEQQYSQRAYDPGEYDGLSPEQLDEMRRTAAEARAGP